MCAIICTQFIFYRGELIFQIQDFFVIKFVVIPSLEVVVLIKRELKTKDSGKSLGGLGGALDLIDSLLFAAPVAWFLWVNASG